MLLCHTFVSFDRFKLKIKNKHPLQNLRKGRLEGDGTFNPAVSTICSNQFKEELTEEIQISPREAGTEKDVKRKAERKYSQDSKRR